ncbi:hypothetical protein BZA05DRAFT_411724 [Tricharina praecox]|uniref:uncharacterized protein n=1 Tax=Tricharina praecox TaxID=43433 RepID=UPI00221ED247|nr:uncharacterized protein BZA05DRAFT_411724 [Tricharina praecox]KAI5842744.1 hypothetical protein BZA05DRAFT_411724 [Tricharina praecox]
MQSFTALILLLLPLTLAVPSPQASSAPIVPPNPCTTKCVTTYKCPTTWPDSCYCYNNAVALCARQCKQEPLPTPKDCTVKPSDCMVKCETVWESTYNCTAMPFPDSCYCKNKGTTVCAEQCKEKAPVLPLCA